MTNKPMTAQEMRDILTRKVEHNQTKKELDPYTVVIRYGIHKDRTIGDLINGNNKNDLSYLMWLQKTTKSDFMVDAIQRAIDKKLSLH